MVPILRPLALVVAAALLLATRVPSQQPWGLPVLALALLVALVCIPQGWRAQRRAWLPRIGSVALLGGVVVPPAARPLVDVSPVAVTVTVFALLLIALPRHRVGRTQASLPGPRAIFIVAALAAVPALWTGAGLLLPDRIAASYEVQVLLGPLVAAPLFALAVLMVGFLLRAIGAAFSSETPLETSTNVTVPSEVTDPAAAAA